MVKKIVVCLTTEKKNSLLWISSEKNYMFELAVEKKFLSQRKTIDPPRINVSNGLQCKIFQEKYICVYMMQ